MITSAEEFVRLRTSEDPLEYRRAASEPADESVVLEILAASGDPDVRDMVARKRKLTPQMLGVLARDPHDGVRLAVASNASATAQVLRELLDDPWDEVVLVAKDRLRTGSHK